jgi:hypothetical protein
MAPVLDLWENTAAVYEEVGDGDDTVDVGVVVMAKKVL